MLFAFHYQIPEFYQNLCNRGKLSNGHKCRFLATVPVLKKRNSSNAIHALFSTFVWMHLNHKQQHENKIINT